MRYTLLQLTQDVLSSIDGDEINSISDTTESLQVVTIIKTCYDDIQSRAELPIQKTLFNLTASGDATYPTLMTKPTTIDHIEWLKYNCVEDGDTDPVWKELTFLDIEPFMLMTQALLPSLTEVETFEYTINGFTFSFHYYNERGPTYYTSFDDNIMIFDAYDADVDSTLQTSKTLAWGELTNVFTQSDAFVPNLQPDQFALLLNEAKSLAWAELRQAEHAKAEKTARRNWAHLGKMKQAIPANQHALGPDFGRRTGSGSIPRKLRSST